MQPPVQLDQQLKDSRKQALGFIKAQLAVTLVVSGVLAAFGWLAAYSALTGGMIATVANAWFALKVFRIDHLDQPAALLTAFYVGEIYRFLLTASLFIMAFLLIKPLNIIVLLSIFFIVHITPAVVNTYGRASRDES